MSRIGPAAERNQASGEVECQRQRIDRDQAPNWLLGVGERRKLQTERVILVPGPPDEVEVVQQIYTRVFTKKQTEHAAYATWPEGHPFIICRVLLGVRDRPISRHTTYTKRHGPFQIRAPESVPIQIASSIPVFQTVIARDPNVAPAYAGIADAYSYLSSTSRTFSPELAFTKMQEACERARLRDPLLAEAFACMGRVHSREFAWREAKDDYHQAFRLNPNLARAHEDFGMWVLFPAGRLEEAEQQLRLAKQLNPLNPRVPGALNMVLMTEHRYDEVAENCRKALSRDPTDFYLRQQLARALIQKGQFSQGA